MYLLDAKKNLSLIKVMAITTAVIVSLPVNADHQWGSYKWKQNPLELTIVDNTNPNSLWPNHLLSANYDWDHGVTTPETYVGWTAEDPDVVTITTTPIGTNTACDPVSGNVQVCNDNYGATNWLGIAQIWLSRGKNKNIIAGVAKLNDYYFDQPSYNSDPWRQLVMCQEVAHTFGLDHQDENFNNDNLWTCMDYTSTPEGNEHPNQHDYEQLALMYASSTEEEPSGSSCNPRSPKCHNTNVPLENPGDWGRLVSGHGGIEIYEKDLANGYRVVTHVTWTLEHAQDDVHRRERDKH